MPQILLETKDSSRHTVSHIHKELALLWSPMLLQFHRKSAGLPGTELL